MNSRKPLLKTNTQPNQPKHQVAYLHSYRATLSLLAQTFLIAAVVRHPRFTEEATARWAIILGMALKYAEVRGSVKTITQFNPPHVQSAIHLFTHSSIDVYRC